MTDFAWLVEAPGQNYLGVREIGHHPEFYWTRDANKALRFWTKEQADLTAMAVRRMEPKLWGFAVTLGEAWPREHGWLPDAALAQQPVRGMGEDDLRDMLAAAYEQGCHDVHENYQPQTDPEFGEAACDYAASIRAALAGAEHLPDLQPGDGEARGS